MDTLSAFFDWVLSASIRASLLTLAVLIFRRLLRHRLPANWSYALWLPVLIVLLTPIYPESRWSIHVKSPLATTTSSPSAPRAGQSTAPPVNPVLTSIPSAPSILSWYQLTSLAWLSGAAVFFIFTSISYVQTMRRFHRSRMDASEALLSELSRLAREIGLRRAPRLWMSRAVRSPAVSGQLRPTLLLPPDFETCLAPQEARLVLRHELMHLKRGDVLMTLLAGLLLALHWFNPLLWLAFFKSRLDCETACDAQVLARENQAQRVAYGHTLLKVESAFSPQRLGLGFAGIWQRGSALRARVQSLARPAPSHVGMKATVALGLTILTLLGITKAAPPDPNAPHIYIEVKFVEIPAESDKPWPAPLDKAKKAPGYLATLSNSQFQPILRDLSQRKGVDLLSAPRVTTKDGLKATIEVSRPMEYKTEKGEPTTKNCGVFFGMIPRITGVDQIDLEASPEIVEFSEFKEHKSGWKEPIFHERKLKWHGAITSGQTMVLELEPQTDYQTVEDSDEAGRIIHTEIVASKKRLLVFVTARLLDPVTGKPLYLESGEHKH